MKIDKLLLDDERIKNLETVNKILRDLVEEYKNRYCEVYENADQLSRKYYQYKAVLEEIKEICRTDCGDCQYNQDCECNFEECEEAKIDDILDKINEVLK